MQVLLVERNKCTTCRHILLHETDAEYCANQDCTRSMHRFDSFAAGFFCSYSTSWKEPERKFVCAVCCIEGRRAQPPFVHPDLQYGNLELEPRQPFFPSPCSTEDERRDLAGEMRLLENQSQISKDAWLRTPQETADLLAAKTARMVQEEIAAANILAASDPASAPVLQITDMMERRTELDGVAPCEPMNSAGFPTVSGKGVGTATGGGDEEEGEEEAEEEEGDEGEEEGDEVVEVVEVTDEGDSDGSGKAPAEPPPASVPALASVLAPASDPPASVPALASVLAPASDPPSVPALASVPAQIELPSDPKEHMAFILKQLVESRRAVAALTAQVNATPGVSLKPKRDQLWMNDEALKDYHDIPALDLDNNQVASKRTGDYTGRQLRVYEEKCATWKEKCETLGYIDFKQKKCTWVCLI